MPRVVVDRFKTLPKVCVVTGRQDGVALYPVRFDSVTGAPELTRTERAVEQVERIVIDAEYGYGASDRIVPREHSLTEIALPFCAEAFAAWCGGARPVRIVRTDDKTIELDIPSAAAVRAFVEHAHAKHDGMMDRLREASGKPPREPGKRRRPPRKL
jgi:hypothetical protein